MRSSVTVLAPAKLNLALDVVGIRSISPSQSLRAVMAAYWLVVGALMMAL